VLEDDLSKLIGGEPGALALEGFERDLWRRISLMVAARKAAKKLATWQGAVLLLMVLGVSLAGVTIASRSAGSRQPILSSGEQIAPSTLLFGDRR